MNPIRCYIRPTTCGRTACENDAMAFWQSRDPEHRVMHLTDLTQLAKDIRRASAATSPYHIADAAPAFDWGFDLTKPVEGYYRQGLGVGSLEDAEGRADGGELSERPGVPAGSREARILRQHDPATATPFAHFVAFRDCEVIFKPTDIWPAASTTEVTK